MAYTETRLERIRIVGWKCELWWLNLLFAGWSHLGWLHLLVMGWHLIVAFVGDGVTFDGFICWWWSDLWWLHLLVMGWPLMVAFVVMEWPLMVAFVGDGVTYDGCMCWWWDDLWWLHLLVMGWPLIVTFVGDGVTYDGWQSERLLITILIVDSVDKCLYVMWCQFRLLAALQILLRAYVFCTGSVIVDRWRCDVWVSLFGFTFQKRCRLFCMRRFTLLS